MSINPKEAKRIVTEIFDHYAQYGEDAYVGEPVSLIEHMSQMAELAQSEGHVPEVILAAFFHDIGHLGLQKNNEQMAGFGVKNHEQVGADYLREKGFSERLIKLVKSHVAAKRYLTYKVTEYYEKLSDASKATLVFQGGKMEPYEALMLELDPDFNMILRFRYWDDMAKVPGIAVNNLQELKHMAIEHLLQNGKSAQLHD
jgi:putative nucleotidyltransferase with HDIG domain